MPDTVSKTTQEDYESDSHTRKFLVPSSLKKHIKAAVKILRSRAFNKKYKFDTIAFSGYSGAMIAIPLAQKLGKDLVLVRKPTDYHASSYMVEGYSKVKNYIIVDDFVCSGDTVRRIQRGIKGFAPSATCLGVLPVQEIKGVNDCYNYTDLQTKKLIRYSGQGEEL